MNYKRVTEKNLLKKLEHHDTISIIISLNSGLCSRHNLTLSNNNTHIVDESMVDGDRYTVTIKQYLKGWYGEAIRKRAVYFDK